MKSVLNRFLSLFQVLRRPREYFANTSGQELTATALWGGAGLLVLASLIIFASMLIGIYVAGYHDAALKALQDQIGMQASDLPYDYNPGIPFFALLFGVYWLILVALIGTGRFLLVLLLDESPRSFALPLAITMHCVVPMLLIAVAIGILNNVAPLEVQPAGSTGAAVDLGRLWMSVLAVTAGMIWEIVLATIALKAVFSQKTGRAALTAMLPWFATCILATFVVFLGG